MDASAQRAKFGFDPPHRRSVPFHSSSRFERVGTSVGFWWIVCIFSAAIRAWNYRHAMNPDGLSYLDLASLAARDDPFALVNGYWSPGYPALISLAFRVFRPTPAWEFPIIHLVNLLIFLFTLWTFSFFFRRWHQLTYGREVAIKDNKRTQYSVPFAYCIFLYSMLSFIGVETVTPDMAVASVVFLAAAISCRLWLPEAERKHYVAFGCVLGIGYYLKAAMFLIGFGLLLLQIGALLIMKKDRCSRLVWSLAAFFIVAAPLIGMLSLGAGRFSIGEAGRLNYAWYVNGLEKHAGWTQSGEFGSPEHPPRVLEKNPVVLEFDGPVQGTFPLWYDPSYWHSGLNNRFNLSRQIMAVRRNLGIYLRTIFPPMLGLIAGMIILFELYLQRRGNPSHWGMFWPQAAWPVMALAMYALVHIEPRFVGGFLVLLWLAIYGGLIANLDRRIMVAVCGTVIWTILLPFVANSAEIALRTAKGIFKPEVPAYEAAAIGLHDLGLKPGDRIATVGYPFHAFYARRAGLRVIACVPDANSFWRMDRPEVKTVTERLREIGVRAVVALNRPETAEASDWREVYGDDSLRISVLLVSPGGSGSTLIADN